MLGERPRMIVVGLVEQKISKNKKIIQYYRVVMIILVRIILVVVMLVGLAST